MLSTILSTILGPMNSTILFSAGGFNPFFNATACVFGANSTGDSRFKGDIAAISVVDHVMTQDECYQVYDLLDGRYN